MFKLVLLFAFVAVVAAEPEPGTYFGLPITPFSTYVSPASTTITKQASSVVQPSPYYVSTPLAYSHFIKKRSAPLNFGYITPTSYIAPAPFATTYSAPLIHNTAILPTTHAVPYVAATHLIKKRSAPLFPISTYIAPTTYAAQTPLLASPYSAQWPLIPSSHVISTPFTHLIKKRSAPIVAPVLSTYIAPTSYSHQSRIDLHSSPLISTFPSHPFVYSHAL